MYSFGGEGKERYCYYENILDYVSEIKIISFYMKQPIRYNNSYRSPLREDRKPSIAFYPAREGYKEGRMMDFSRPGSPILILTFIKKLLKKKNYADALDQINYDFDIGLFYLNGHPPKNKFDGYTGQVDENQSSNSYSDARSHIQEFTKRDEIFWNNFGISLDTLKKFNVFSTRKVLMPSGTTLVYSISNPIYTYSFSNKTKKIYLPLNKIGARFLGFGPTPLQGYDQLPEKGELLIVTKSMKDVMLLYELGYNAVAPNSESTGIDSSVFEDLKKRFNKIVLFYDNDEAGIKASNVFSEIYNIPYMMLDPSDAKDISDYYYYNVRSHNSCKEKVKKLLEDVI